jgi:peptide-methionine (S)-S-oxide reductase
VGVLVLFGGLNLLNGGGRNFSEARERETMTLTMNNAVTEAVMPSPKVSVPSRIETATFAMGWFWGPDAQFGSIEGVVRTRVGYSGGTKHNPSYHGLGDHSETIEIDYDPTVVTYENLLEVFWHSHDPLTPTWSRQYMSAVFYHDEEQRRLAVETRDREALRRGGQIHTEIVPASRFYPAEDYHQKYHLRQRPELMREFKTITQAEQDFVNSTAAARINGYLAGHGDYPTLRAELGASGLSPAASKRLLDIVGGLRR